MGRGFKKIMVAVLATIVLAGEFPVEALEIQNNTSVVSEDIDSDENGSVEVWQTDGNASDGIEEENDSMISTMEENVPSDEGEERESTASLEKDEESIVVTEETIESSDMTESNEVEDELEQDTENEENMTEELLIPNSDGSFTPEGADYSLEYQVVNNESITITGISDKNATGNLVIPSEIGGIKVTEIRDYAFSNCSGLTGSLIIPDSVTKIGTYTFSGCSGFTGNLMIPDSVTKIGNCAFGGCSGFEGNLIIPDSVTEIGYWAFEDCSGLTGNLTIPNAVTEIESGVFSGCSALTGTLTLPNGMTKIGYYAFEGCSGLTGNLTIPDSVTEIGSYAFSKCSGLTGSLIIPDGVLTIGSSAFNSCKGLSGSLSIGKGVTEIGERAFYYCSNMKGDLILPDGITIIGDSAFWACSGLRNIQIPASMQKIEKGAFDDAYGGKKITVLSDSLSLGELCLGENSAIYGHSGSAAEEYADKNGCIFIPLDGTTQITEYKVSTVEELLQTIGSNRRIILEDGFYDFYGNDWDARCLIIDHAVNLSIEAQNPGKAEFLVPGDWPVVYVKNSARIKISGCILGHNSVSFGGCPANVPVIMIESSSDTEIDHCDLYGCGVWGLTCNYITGISIKNSVIRDCKEGIINGYGAGGNVSFTDCIISGNAYDEKWEYGHNYTAIKRDDVSFEKCMFLNNYNTSLGEDNLVITDCTFYNNAWDGGTPQPYGICLNGITWQVNGTTLRLGYPLQLDTDKIIQSEKGKVIDYSDSALPWRRCNIEEVDVAEGIEYSTSPEKPDTPQDEIASGTYMQMKWKIDVTGKLIVSGKGNYAASAQPHCAPWYNYRESVKTAEVNLTGITSAAYMFEGCDNLTELNLSGLDALNITNTEGMLNGCAALDRIICACHLTQNVTLPAGSGEIWYEPNGAVITQLPTNLNESIIITKNEKPHIERPYIIASKHKKSYVCGDTLNLDDLTVQYYDIDGTVTNVVEYTTNADTIDMSAAGIKILTITYNGLTADIQLVVSEKNVENVYTVIFDTQNHGIAPEPYTNVEKGSKIQEPQAPVVEGFLFTGWYKESDCKTLWNFDKDTIESDTVLYAGWKPDGGSGDDTPSDNVPDGIWIADIKECTYTGQAVKPSVVVYYNKKRLTAGRDYTVTYQNNTKASLSSSSKAPTVIVKGKENYSGTKKLTFTINKAHLTGIENLKAAESYPKKVKYTPVVTLGGNTLKAGTDYILTYLDANGNKLKKQPTKVGNYQMHIVGKGSCEGEINFSYAIVETGGANAINKGKATVGAMTYGGLEPEVSLTVGDKTLKQNKDYIVSFTNSNKKGTATATFIGIGDYAGTLKKSFKVQAAPIQEKNVQIAKTVPYEKGGAKPEISVAVNGTELVAGTDYTVTYKNNAKVGNAKAVIKGKGNFTGTLTKEFKVEPKNLTAEGVKIYVSDVLSGKKPTVIIYDSNGKKLSANSDYKADIDKTAHKVTIASGKNGLYKTQNPVTIQYKELKKGRQVTSATLNKNASGFPKYFVYTGKEIELEKDWLTVKAGKTVLKSNEFEILGYVNNIRKGTASVIIRGTKEYGGIKVLTFKITARGLL